MEKRFYLTAEEFHNFCIDGDVPVELEKEVFPIMSGQMNGDLNVILTGQEKQAMDKFTRLIQEKGPVKMIEAQIARENKKKTVYVSNNGYKE